MPPDNNADSQQPKTYRIEKLTDILQIPEDRLDYFLEDLKTYHHMGIHMTKLLETVAEVGGIKAEVIPRHMNWIDDDKHEVKVHLITDDNRDADAQEGQRK